MPLRDDLADLKKRRRSVRPADMDALLQRAGFVRRQGKGDHWVYAHKKLPFPLTIDPRNPLLPVYVSKAIRASRRRSVPMKTIDEYLDLPYAFVVTHDVDEEGRAGWVAEVEELPGCISQGLTPEEALEHVRDALRAWISVALEDGVEVPEPRAATHYSGRFVVRVPASLHADLVRKASHEGVSLNQFVTGALAGAVGWRGGSPQGGRRSVRRRSSGRSVGTSP